MRLFFKFIAVFLALSLQIFSEEEIKYVKVEVASVVWKNQTTNELFPKIIRVVIMYNSKMINENSIPNTLLKPRKIKKILNNPTIHKSIIFSATKLPTRKLNFISFK